MTSLLFFELLQVSLGRKICLSKNPSDEEWKQLFKICQEQALAGVVFTALEQLSESEQKPPLSILYEWIGLTEQIKQQNLIVNKNAVELCRRLKEDGYECCILKGQGNNLKYPYPYSRTPGDIDMWITPKTGVNCKKNDVRNVIKYAKKRNPRGKAFYHHVDFGVFQGTEVEVHYRPSFMFNPMHNLRLQRWFIAKQREQFHNQVVLPSVNGVVNVPTAEFNIVFQLSHVYNHLLHQGIGMRQILDYFYVLKSDLKIEKESVFKTLRYLGLEKIAGAMMWVLNEKLGLEVKYLIAPKDEKRGKVLLAEIMKGGNFGHYDVENQKANNRFKKGVQRCKRDLRMLRYFPSECLWEPVFRICHVFWRLRYNAK